MRLRETVPDHDEDGTEIMVIDGYVVAKGKDVLLVQHFRGGRVHTTECGRINLTSRLRTAIAICNYEQCT